MTTIQPNTPVMHETPSLFSNSAVDLQNISNISISIASPDDVLAWSCGEVKKSETISYRTYKPESDGLFSGKIFGPVKDYECQCGKYKRIKYKGITCEKCGVEVTTSRVRRERLGHIELAAPVAHILFLRGTNSPIGTLLGMTVKDIEKILYFDSYVVLDAGNTTLKKRQMMTEDEYNAMLDRFGDSFTASSGAEAVREMLADIDLAAEIEVVKSQLAKTNSDVKKRSLMKRIKMLGNFLSSGNRPEWMIVKRISVLPPDLRPLVQLDGGRFVSSDLNELYKRVINRSDRLTRMMEAKAPYIIICNEKRMLQEVVDALFDNSKKSVVAKSATGRALKSLSEYLKGKTGRFRQNLLGKRVDYSGRSVIMVGPTLRLHQCGLPKIMALELFKPFIFQKLMMYGHVSSVKMAKKMVDSKSPEVWDVLEGVIKEHVVLLNRAPTLHRLNIQAFEPKLIEAKAIQLHPLVCKAFNADFDGDQMAVHVPLSIEAQIESRVLMISSNNILSPQNGQPIIVPTKDIVVGLYYITSPVTDAKGTGTSFDEYSDMLMAIDAGRIQMNTEINYYYSYTKSENEAERNEIHVVKTTPGRVALFNLLPCDGKMKFEECNVTINNKTVAVLLDRVYQAYGQKMVVLFADKIMGLGFKYSTISGLSFGKDDMIIPESKQGHIDSTLEKIKTAEQQYRDGYITFREKYNQVTDRWSECTDRIAKDMMAKVSDSEGSSKVNSIHIMMNSGARVSEALLRQISGMRGLIAKPSGEIIETPIISNFKEGLTVLEYFNSAHGARKGAADTALKTADAGYLTRRLVDVAQDCIATEHCCGTKNGVTYKVKMEDGVVTEKLSSMVLHRILSSDMKDNNGNVVLPAGTLLSNKDIDLIDSPAVSSATVLSPVTCETKEGICSSCYGRDLATGEIVNIGEVVGIIAAQSIGEPGAQLTMRTFHIGGAASRTVQKSSLSSLFAGTAKMHDLRTVTNREGNVIVVSNNSFVSIVNKDGIERVRHELPYGAKLHIADGDSVGDDTRLASWDPYNNYIFCEYSGFVKFEDMKPGVSYKEKVDEELGNSHKVVIDWSSVSKTLNPRLSVVDASGANKPDMSGSGEARYTLPVDAILSFNDGDKVEPGDQIARMPRESVHAAKDITGGLPRVEDIFEARSPKDPAIISEIAGVASFPDAYKTKNMIVIEATDGSGRTVNYNIPRGKYVKVQSGAQVQKGEIIVDGGIDLQDVLYVGGVEALTSYVVDEVQQIYKLQGVKIDNKHIEIIVKYMLQKVEIVDPGDLPFVHFQQVDKYKLLTENELAMSQGKKPATYKLVLQGITRASIQTESFISAASFQETTRVLTDAAICGKTDPLKGMKENVIVGRLIPAGTGYVVSQMKKAAHEKDKQEGSGA